MNNYIIPRIQLNIEGRQLQAFVAISAEFRECGKAGTLGLSINKKEQKKLKFNNVDFLCVYKAIIRSLNGDRYPNKSGNEYIALCNLKEYFETECINQRGMEITCL
jgi:hypothetical protein